MKVSIVIVLMTLPPSHCFVQSWVSGPYNHRTTQGKSLILPAPHSSHTAIWMSATQATPNVDAASQTEFPPILTELRDVAMKLHTKEQAPREGQASAPEKLKVPFVPNQADYLNFLVDSHAVYETLEEIVNKVELTDELGRFRNTGLERTVALEKDIEWMCKVFQLEKPEVGNAGQNYSEELRNIITINDDGTKEGVPEFMCHYYNFVFAHLAGGRMIGKQMSKMLLDGETLEFYKVSQSFVNRFMLRLPSILINSQNNIVGR